MGRSSDHKRPRDSQGKHSDAHTPHKRPKSGQDHVQNTLAQSLHEVSTSSDGLFSGDLAVSSQRSIGTIRSSPPKSVAKSVPHVPQMQRATSASRSHQNLPENLPQLPPIADKSLEDAVFTHPACLQGHNQTKLTKSYDRLEFLGDAYIELIASRLVYSRYPHMPAGRLSQQRENLVKNESLAFHSIAYGFEKRALLPPKVSTLAPPSSKLRPNDPERQWTKILGDIFEAYVAAIVLSNASNGYQVAEEWLHQLWIPKLNAQTLAEIREPPAADSKQQLSKRVMGKGVKLEYRDSAPADLSESTAGKTWYTIAAFLTGWGWQGVKLGEGRALNKKEAGMIAATQALENPLTGQIAKVKRDFDEKVAKERAAQEQEKDPRERESDRGEGPMLQYRGNLRRLENEEGELSDSHDFDDSDTA